MRRVAVLLLLLVCGCRSYPASDPRSQKVVLPEGDPAAGRVAFVELGCASCHAVVGDGALPAVEAPEPGPTLGYVQTRQSEGWLASSIIDPGHATAYGSADWLDDHLTRMPSFNQVLTVQQLVDLVAFLKALPAEPA